MKLLFRLYTIQIFDSNKILIYLCLCKFHFQNWRVQRSSKFTSKRRIESISVINLEFIFDERIRFQESLKLKRNPRIRRSAKLVHQASQCICTQLILPIINLRSSDPNSESRYRAGSRFRCRKKTSILSKNSS